MALSRCPVSLSDEQRALVEATALSPDRVVCVEGAAGAGKTTALRVLGDALSRSGVPVLGAAPSGRAADELERATDIPAADPPLPAGRCAALGRPSARLRAGDRRGRHGRDAGARAGPVAGRARPAARRSWSATRPSFPRSAPAASTRRSASASEPSAWSRTAASASAAERDALARLRAGDAEGYLGHAAREGRLLVADDATQAKQRLLADWWRAAAEGDLRETVMLAHRRADVRDLNEGARALLRRGGTARRARPGGRRSRVPPGRPGRLPPQRSRRSACATARAGRCATSIPCSASSRCSPTAARRASCRPATPPSTSSTATRSPATPPRGRASSGRSSSCAPRERSPSGAMSPPRAPGPRRASTRSDRSSPPMPGSRAMSPSPRRAAWRAPSRAPRPSRPRWSGSQRPVAGERALAREEPGERSSPRARPPSRRAGDGRPARPGARASPPRGRARAPWRRSRPRRGRARAGRARPRRDRSLSHGWAEPARRRPPATSGRRPRRPSAPGTSPPRWPTAGAGARTLAARAQSASGGTRSACRRSSPVSRPPSAISRPSGTAERAMSAPLAGRPGPELAAAARTLTDALERSRPPDPRTQIARLRDEWARLERALGAEAAHQQRHAERLDQLGLRLLTRAGREEGRQLARDDRALRAGRGAPQRRAGRHRPAASRARGRRWSAGSAGRGIWRRRCLGAPRPSRPRSRAGCRPASPTSSTSPLSTSPWPSARAPSRAGPERWRQGAAAIEGYRERHGITDPQRALGPEPEERLALGERRSVERAVEDARAELSYLARAHERWDTARPEPGYDRGPRHDLGRGHGARPRPRAEPRDGPVGAPHLGALSGLAPSSRADVVCRHACS